tara:strand:- start:978 stop:1706 length:729 start_codon:yes stop_codon:yes gene_type:complete
MGMSVDSREMQWHLPFGPVIMESTISDETHKILLSRADQLREGTHPNKDINAETNDYRNKLAGCLSEEYSYAKAFTKEEMETVENEFTWLAHNFTTAAFKAGKIKDRMVRRPEEIIMNKPLWVNYMKSGEWNPSHNHTGKISCVTYLRVPKEIEDENDKGEHTSKSNTPSAGRIEFQFGNVGMPYSSGGYIRTPREKDIFFFPAALSHMVYPFQADTERVSVSVNFEDKVELLQALQTDGER